MAEAPALASPGARDYEAIYILRPDIEPEAATKISNRISEVLAREKGKLVKVESWGRRKLAYPVRKFRRGIYIYLRFHGNTNLVAEFERNLRMQRDAVLKFMTILIAKEVDDVEVAAEDVEFAAIEPLSEDEVDESREKLLGLVDTHHEHRHARDDRRQAAEPTGAPAAADAASAPAETATTEAAPAAETAEAAPVEAPAAETAEAAPAAETAKAENPAAEPVESEDKPEEN
ncbi:MAG: 30S ribosomal protein S6 [Sorangium cellulosum]|nr:MAG: 30S ribosomal protein S6 [Sorangium cellulosum]